MSIFLDGIACPLEATPLRAFLRQIRFRPASAYASTASDRGYEARWELLGDRLFLAGLFRHVWMAPPHPSGRVDPDHRRNALPDVRSLRLADIVPDEAPLVQAS